MKDSSKPKKEAAASQPLVIANRAIMGHDVAGGSAVSTSIEVRHEPTPAAAPPSKRTVVAPVTPPEGAAPSQPEPTPQLSQAAAPDDPQLTEATPTSPPPQPSPDRSKEAQRYIDSRKFFVPINTAAHKRSVLASAGLTIVVLLLGIVLVDLMLDSGIILLLQKIPHTHFFDLSD
jgi:hypothetical protein